jgi:MFS family permease
MGMLNKIAKIGILITAISLFASAYIMDNIKNGYIISFGITVGCFTLSSFIMFLFRCSIKPQETSTIGFFKDLKTHAALFLKNKIILILLIASTITAFVQTIGSIYYGIFIYNFLNNTGFGGFLNVAVVFIVATLSSLLAPYLTRINSKAYGKFPMLVFGTLLIAIMPLTYFYNPNLVAISMATMIGIIGAAIVGVANGLLILDILHERDRKYYFRVSNLLITIPYIITIPIGSFIAQAFGLKTLFLVLGLTLVCAVMPLYLIIIILYHRKFKV